VERALVRFVKVATVVLLTSLGLYIGALEPQGKTVSQSSHAGASIVGHVVSSQTGRAMEGVHVRLLSIQRSPDNVIVYGAISRQTGQFSIHSIHPGSYLLTAEKVGFVFVPAGDKPGEISNALSLQAGQNLTNLKLQMTPRAVISGHVLDEYGDPMAGVPVQVVPAKPDPMTNGRYTATDDRGEFRVSIAPGKYYVKAGNSSTAGDRESEEIRTDGTTETSYSETYYPDSLIANAASLLQLLPGSELSGVDIHLVHSTPHAIGGLVSGIPSTAKSVTVTLISGTSSYGTGFSSDGNSAKAFRFAHLSPGFYRVYAQCAAGDHQLQSPIAEIKLSDSDARLNLVLGAGADIVGKVNIAGLSAEGAEALGGRYVQMTSNVMGAAPLSAPVARDGEIHIRDVFAGKYVVQLQPLRENEFIQSITLNGTPASENTIDLSDGVEGSKLTITVNPNGGQISGRVQFPDGGQVFVPAVVMLERDGNTTPEAIRSSAPGPDGSYTFKALPPGKYKLFAVSLIGAKTEVADLLKQYDRLAEIVAVKEADRESKDLKVLTAEARE
jgi:hypothetical protein